MNRKLKFRIWDNRYKCFLENGSSLHCESNWQINPFTGEVSDFISAISWEEASYSKEEFPEGRFTIQQFTGLKDSKKNEIYEGDIIEIVNHILPEKVLFICGFFGVHLNYKNSKDKRRQDNDPCDTYPLADLESIKIIGNIFESPNLLK